jgi:translation initiation factor 5A
MGGTKVQAVNQLKKGSYVVMEGSACTVTDTQTSRSGKHGHAKVRLVAVGIIDGKKRDMFFPAHENVEVPIIEKLDAQVLSVTGDSANLIDMKDFITFDMKIPEELKDSVKPGSNVLYWDILGDKVMKQLKSAE